jgi:hypothetical protein
MKRTPKPPLLEALRAKAEAIRAQDAAARRPIEQAREEIDACLWRTFRWFDEALGHLEVIRPTIAREFRLGDLLHFERPQFDRGFVSFRRRSLALHETLEQVEVFYRLTSPRPFVLRVPPGAATGIEQRLRASTMDFRYETEQDDRGVVRYGVFRIEPAMRATIVFEPDYGREVIDVTLSNVDRFESVRLMFDPARLDVAALEDLVELMLGEPSGFLHRAPLALIRGRELGAAEVPPPE